VNDAPGFDRTLSDEDVLRRRASLLQRLHIDGPLLLLLTALGIIGLFVLWSAGGKHWELLLKQATSFGIGLLAMFTIAQLEPRFMARWAPLAYAGGVTLLLWVELFGYTAMGATRWINIPGVIRFQPSEFMKLIMPATIAWYLSARSLPPSLKHMGISLLLIGVPFVLILKQPDLGTALMVMVPGAFVLFLAGLRWRWIFSAIAAAVPIAVAMWYFVLHDYQKQPRADLPRPRARSAGQRLEHHPVQGRHRLGRRAGQGLAAGHPVAPGFFAGKSHGLYHCRPRARSSAWSASACCWWSTCC